MSESLNYQEDKRHLVRAYRYMQLGKIKPDFNKLASELLGEVKSKVDKETGMMGSYLKLLYSRVIGG